MGNPEVLRVDVTWSIFIDYCVSNGVYTSEKVVPEKPHMIASEKPADSDKKSKSRLKKTKKPQRNDSQTSECTYVPPHLRKCKSTSKNTAEDSTEFFRQRNSKPPVRKVDSKIQASKNSSSKEDLLEWFNKLRT